MPHKLLTYIPVAIIAWFILSGAYAVYYVANSDLSTDFKDGDSFTVYPFVIQDSAAKYANSRTRTCTLCGITIVEAVETTPSTPAIDSDPADAFTPSPNQGEK